MQRINSVFLSRNRLKQLWYGLRQMKGQAWHSINGSWLSSKSSKLSLQSSWETAEKLLQRWFRLCQTSLLFMSLSLLVGLQALAQELNARVMVNTERLGAVDRSSYADLEKQLTDLLNQHRFTHTTFSPTERIECTFSINILTRTDAGEYTAELFVSAQRPVYNASYLTPLITHRDTELNFSYQPYDPIEFNPNDLHSNLITTLMFHAYFVLALDFDSFSPLGGNLVKGQMRQLANLAQQKPDWQGWTPFGSDYNRYAIAESYNNTIHEPFRMFWYQYHRMGLDEMSGNVRRGYTNILEALPQIEETWKSQMTSPLVRLFAQTKLEELAKLLQEAPRDQRDEAYKLLKKIYPTEEHKLAPLKQ